jgi:hypothetical protein
LYSALFNYTNAQRGREKLLGLKPILNESSVLVALRFSSTNKVLTTSRLLALFAASTRKAPTLKSCLLLPRGPRQRPFAPFSNNARMAGSFAYALAADTSNAASPFYRRSASCRRVGGLPSKYGRPAVASSSMLLALRLLHIQLERLSHYPVRGRHPACWTWHMGRRRRPSTQ